MRLVVFESSLRANFRPLSLTRPTFDLNFGIGTLLSRIEQRVGNKASDLYVPEYLRDVTQEKHPEVKVNEEVSQKCLLVNALIGGRDEVWATIDQAVSENIDVLSFDSQRNLVFGIAEEANPDQFARKSKWSSSRAKPFVPEVDESALLRFPWKLVEENESAITEDFSRKYFDRQHFEGNCETRGSAFSISNDADLERFVTLDSRKGPIIIEDEAQIQSFSHLCGPCFIGKGSIVKSARIREGTTIGENCRVGGEVEQSIISDYSNKNHDGFIGHSIVGSWVNLGALTTNSDLKNTYGEIKVNLGKKQVRTGSVKVGVFIGDFAKTAIGVMIGSGKSIGASAQALGNVYDDVPSFTIYSGGPRNKAVEMYIDSAILTQKRMMARRGISMTGALETMMKSVFKMTRRDRTDHHVSKGKFK